MPSQARVQWRLDVSAFSVVLIQSMFVNVASEAQKHKYTAVTAALMPWGPPPTNSVPLVWEGSVTKWLECNCLMCSSSFQCKNDLPVYEMPSNLWQDNLSPSCKIIHGFFSLLERQMSVSWCFPKWFGSRLRRKREWLIWNVHYFIEVLLKSV